MKRNIANKYGINNIANKCGIKVILHYSDDAVSLHFIHQVTNNSIILTFVLSPNFLFLYLPATGGHKTLVSL